MNVTCTLDRPSHVHAVYAVMTDTIIEPEANAPLPDERLLRLRGASADELARLRSRPHDHLVTGKATLEDAIEMQRETRARAVHLANQHDGMIIDLHIPTMIPVKLDDGMIASSWVWFDYTKIDDNQLIVLGLEAFGLPQLVIDKVVYHDHAMYSALATGLAQRLIDEWPAHDPIGTATITLRDIAYGLGDAHAATTPISRGAEVAMAYDPATDAIRVETDSNLSVELFG